MTAITKTDAFFLLEKYHADSRVIQHVSAVHDYAMEIAANVDCDRELVEAGSLLHDIGRCRSHNMDHGIIGADILRDEHVDERVVRIV
jgi:putative nucleotidyltransferase with HDIG domain